MNRSEKQGIVDSLVEQISSYNHFYLADIESLDAEKTSALRRLCYEQDVKIVVVKNTLLKRAIETSGIEGSELFTTLKGNTSVMFSNVGNAPAKLITDFSKKNDKPVLKGAYVEQSVYVGADQLPALVAIKSKEELLGDVISALQSPAKNVISALLSAGQTIAGVVKTLEERDA